MTESSKKILFLAISILFLILYNVISFQGYFGYDDLEYVNLAKDIIEGKFQLSQQSFSARWAVIYLLAFSYQLFGINDFSSALPTLIMTIFSILILFYWLKEQKLTYLVLAISFFLTDFYTLFFSSKIYPDSFVTCSVLGISCILLKNPFQKKQFFAWQTLFLFLFIWLGLLSKLTIFFIFIPMIWYVLVDSFQYKNSFFWLKFTAFMLISTFLYLSIYYFSKGNFLYPFEQIVANQYTTVCSYHEYPIKQLLIRLTYGPIFMFIGSGMMIGLMGAFFRKNPLNIFFILYFLAYYFMSTSYQHYLPMCTVEARHFLPLIPLAAILMADYLENANHYYHLIILNLIIILTCLFFISTNLIFVFILLQIILIFKQSNITIFKKYFNYFIIGILLIHPLHSMWKNRAVEYTSIKQLMDKNHQGKKILIP